MKAVASKINRRERGDLKAIAASQITEPVIAREYQAIFKSNGKPMVIIDHDTTISLANAEFERLSGYTKKEIEGTKKWAEFVAQEDRKRMNEYHLLRKSDPMLAPRCFEFRFVDRYGKIKNIVLTIGEITGTNKSMASLQDVTDRRRTDQALRESGEKYRDIFDSMLEGYFEVDLAGNFTFFNQAVSAFFGYPHDELRGLNYRKFTSPEEAQRLFQVFNEVYKTGNPHEIRDYEIVKKDGSIGIAAFSVSLLRNSSGEPIGFRSVTRDVTKKKETEKALRRSEEKYRSILEDVAEGYSELDLRGNLTFFNGSLLEIYGYTRDELMHMNYRQYMDEENAKKVYQAYNKVYTTGKPDREIKHEIIRKDGTRRYLENSVSRILDADGQPLGFRGVVRDITERRRAEEALRQSEEKYRTIIENMQDGYFEIDLTGSYTFANDALCKRQGYSKEELIGMDNRQFQDETNAKKTYQAFNEIYRTGEPVKALDMEVIRKDGTKGISEVSVSLIKDAQGNPIGFRGVSRDVTERKREEEEVAYMATHDSLTGLPNRTLFSDRLTMALTQARRTQKNIAVMLLDLDYFKDVNDTLGHSMGDHLLRAVGNRLSGLLRKGDTIARIGGDEFLLLLPELLQIEYATTLAQKILHAFREPFAFNDHQLHITTSIGIAIFPDDGDNADTLMKNADIAMYRTKNKGRDGFQRYTTA